MLRTSRVVVVRLLVLVSTPALSQQAPKPSDLDVLMVMKLLLAKGQRFAEYVRDFKDYGENYPVEIDRATSLLNEAGRASDVLDGMITALWVYLHISLESDRTNVRPMLQERLAGNAKKLDYSVSVVNIYVSRTPSAAIAASAARMKDDLRETIELLKSIKLP